MHVPHTRTEKYYIFVIGLREVGVDDIFILGFYYVMIPTQILFF